jgi:cyclase
MKRIIPCLDILNGRVVKGIQFEGMRDAGDPVECARLYVEQGADELVFLDIAATVEGRDILLDLVRRVAREVSVPFAVGGGIRTADDFGLALDAGADKVSVNTAAVRNPDLLSQAARQYGSARVVLALDVKKAPDGGYHVLVSGGKEDSGLDAVQWAKRAVSLGAGEILLTSKDRDGAKTGYDLDITRQIADAVPVPVIASGGAGKREHFRDALTLGGADAALAASLFHFREISVPELKQYLREQGVEVR